MSGVSSVLTLMKTFKLFLNWQISDSYPKKAFSSLEQIIDVNMLYLHVEV